MSPEGIWTTEIMGIFGWESTGVMVLENGRAIDGGNHHYSVGRYESANGDVRISLSVEYYGTPRTIFGAADKNLSVEINGKLGKDTIEGTVHRLDKPNQKVTIKMSRRADVPAAG